MANDLVTSDKLTVLSTVSFGHTTKLTNQSVVSFGPHNQTKQSALDQNQTD